ncbi:MAG: hypothetical protein ABIW82_04770 [Dokdonella sp.]
MTMDDAGFAAQLLTQGRVARMTLLWKFVVALGAHKFDELAIGLRVSEDHDHD